MKFTFLAWFFIFLCGHTTSNMAFEGKPTSKQEDFTLSEPGKYGLNDTGKLNEEDERKEYKGNHELFPSIKGQKGKGAYGGANIVHRPRPGEKNAAILTVKPSFFVSATMLYVSWALVLTSLPILS
ncbi:hypothetical protein P3X46_010759 [Hevea brasiliensis]|uniref:BURP domain-containing protein n=1 Tax=Hevea brasiliensis TaxID=3981 RepID=A0ABQ9MJ53_HEVBR|nr:uncharacterized protein LOC110672658 [Hevea brasiliensis]KAJ9178914.1 hypothetical protein P3X46_010759 [Hevea brasiliensis]